jgi:hypothetical protein
MWLDKYMNTTITTDLHSYELDLDPYDGHVYISVDGGRREIHFDKNFDEAISRLLAMVKADIQQVASRPPWIEV